MPESHSLPERVNIYIQRPACPRCSAQMMLARIMPYSVGFDLRTFECPKCQRVHEVIVETGAFGRP
jgi:transposase-like protein